MRIDVKISDAVLQWIIHSIRLESLPPETANNLVKWASGEKTPTFNQVEKASTMTSVLINSFRDRVNDHSLILHSILYLSFLSDSCGSIQESIKN